MWSAVVGEWELTANHPLPHSIARRLTIQPQLVDGLVTLSTHISAATTLLPSPT
jgi:hypothetical protein